MKTTRRGFVRAALGGFAGAALVGCSSDSNGGSGGGADAPAGGADAVGGGDGAASCTVYPRQTEGPYYLDLNSIRADITEGKPGAPLALVIRVLGADGCTALAGVAVDVWHCTHDGVYSGYPGQLGGVDTTGQTFLRGTQVTGADGRATFATIYPGWYPGRTTHIHFKVHLAGGLEATSQLYFDEATTSGVYATGVYAARGDKDTTNAGDGVNGGSVPPLLAVTADGDGWAGALDITVAS